MQKIKAKRLENVINYFANEYQNQIWKAEASKYVDKEWKVEVRLINTAFRHELNSLMMLVNYSVAASVNEKVDDNGKIYWMIW